MKFANCWIFAFLLHRRRHARIMAAEKGDKLFGRRHYRTRRKSDSGWFPHFLYVEELPHSGHRFISYKPAQPVERSCPPVVFDGVVRWGDAPCKKDH